MVGPGYEFEPVGNNALDAHPLLAKQPRYCLMCGELLPPGSSRDEPMRCDHCGRPFSSEDPSSYAPVPPPQPIHWWEGELVPGVAWLVLYTLGSVVANAVLPNWMLWLSGGAGQGQPDPRAGQAAGVLVAVMLLIFGLIPWLFTCLYLLLLALEEHLRDEVVWYISAGALLGMFSVIGYHPAMLLIGLVLGAFAGLVRQWRMAG